MSEIGWALLGWDAEKLIVILKPSNEITEPGHIRCLFLKIWTRLVYMLEI